MYIQFLPFYFGAAQLRNQQDMLPSCIHDKVKVVLFLLFL